jgi:hypothetical protein
MQTKTSFTIRQSQLAQDVSSLENDSEQPHIHHFTKGYIPMFVFQLVVFNKITYKGPKI